MSLSKYLTLVRKWSINHCSMSFFSPRSSPYLSQLMIPSSDSSPCDWYVHYRDNKHIPSNRMSAIILSGRLLVIIIHSSVWRHFLSWKNLLCCSTAWGKETLNTSVLKDGWFVSVLSFKHPWNGSFTVQHYWIHFLYCKESRETVDQLHSAASCGVAAHLIISSFWPVICAVTLLFLQNITTH